MHETEILFFSDHNIIMIIIMIMIIIISEIINLVL